MGYPSKHRGYKCYDLSSRKILVSRHVIFDETVFPFSKLHAPTSSSYDFLDTGLTPLPPSPAQSTPPNTQVYPTETPQSQPAEQSPLLNHSSQPLSSPLSPVRTPLPILLVATTEHTTSSNTLPIAPQPHSPQMTTRSQHGIFKPRQLLNLHTSAAKSISPLPTNPINALHDHNWKMAMKDEYDALIENKTWD